MAFKIIAYFQIKDTSITRFDIYYIFEVPDNAKTVVFTLYIIFLHFILFYIRHTTKLKHGNE